MKKRMVMVATTLAGVVAGAAAVWKTKGKKEALAREFSDKHLSIMLMYNQWLVTKQEGKSVVTFFKEKGYNNIAIYGMSYVGERLLDELKDSDIIVQYAIDKNADHIYADVDVVSPEDVLDKVDAVVVTSNYYFDVIEESLRDKVDCPILNFEDILYEI